MKLPFLIERGSGHELKLGGLLRAGIVPDAIVPNGHGIVRTVLLVVKRVRVPGRICTACPTRITETTKIYGIQDVAIPTFHGDFRGAVICGNAPAGELVRHVVGAFAVLQVKGVAVSQIVVGGIAARSQETIVQSIHRLVGKMAIVVIHLFRCFAIRSLLKRRDEGDVVLVAVARSKKIRAIIRSAIGRLHDHRFSHNHRMVCGPDRNSW